MREGSEQVEEALYKLEPCTDHLALFMRPHGRCISKKRLSQPQSPHHSTLASPPVPSLTPLTPLSRVCVRISVVLNSRPRAFLPPPLSSLSLACRVCICGPSYTLPSLSFPLACRVCICICGGMFSFLPIPCLLMFAFTAAFANTTTSLLPPLFAFTAGPLLQSHIHDPPHHDPSRDCA
jgi:hypothetical protein